MNQASSRKVSSTFHQSPVKKAAQRRRARVLKPTNKHTSIKFALRSRKRSLKQKATKKQVIKTPVDTSGDVAVDATIEAPIEAPIETFQTHNGAGPVYYNLPRPKFPEVSQEALAAVDENLVSAPPAYVRDALRCIGDRLFSVLKTVKSHVGNTSPNEPLKEGIITINHPGPTIVPTHLLVLVETGMHGATVVAVHSLVMAAHCSRFPTLPPSPVASTVPPEMEGKEYQVTLPAFHLRVPSRRAFIPLLEYLYVRKGPELLTLLLPPVSDMSKESWTNLTTMAESLTDQIAERSDEQMILDRLRRVHAMWQTVCVLGINDNFLWKIMNLAWTVCFRAMMKKKEASKATGEAQVKA